MSQWINLVWPPPIPSGMVCFSYTIASKTKQEHDQKNANEKQKVTFGSHDDGDNNNDADVKHIQVSSLPTSPRPRLIQQVHTPTLLSATTLPNTAIPSGFPTTTTRLPQQQNIDLTLIRRIPKRINLDSDTNTHRLPPIPTILPPKQTGPSEYLARRSINSKPLKQTTTKPYDIARYSLPIVPHEHHPRHPPRSSPEKANLQMPQGTFFIAPNGQRIHLTQSQRQWWKNGGVPGQIQ